MFENPSPQAIGALLRRARTVAVVGLSPNENRPSHRVARAMQVLGWRIVPVRPAVTEVLGETAYASLDDIPEALRRDIDLVDVFLAPQRVGPVVDRAIALGLPAIWLQDGVIDEAAAQRAKDAGLTVVMNRCVWRDWVPLATE
ncbi:CoA-binding protein [Methyloversatilis sp.]|uniref:CoA-binding protein n=1 Tax=Methyloversatilis sp. TaxID=2569862 RepID=UPI002735D33E|nr:CoA-binding protein [Methyloversatilis sp.]MDP2870218.1 CoA-binding protein [Methyloversatilis sp.]MDP3456332.1 CoA-binding protein [Methyloversatilis sp.]MDP3579466.1 CoA-binding protein [Methyloversatilis sp.]